MPAECALCGDPIGLATNQNVCDTCLEGLEDPEPEGLVVVEDYP